MYDPWGALAESVSVEFADLPSDLDGYCQADQQRIVIARGLTQTERRVVLCHEAIHVERGGVVNDPRLVDREEAWVRKETARRLVSIRALGDALSLGFDRARTAAELWVTEPTLRTRLEHLHPSERHYLRQRLADASDPEGEA